MRQIINPHGAEGPFSPAVIAGDLIYVSGQGGLVDGTLVEGGTQEQATQALINIDELLTAAGAGSDDIVAVTCYLVDIAEWDELNVAWSRFFEGRTVPTRTAIGVAGLPKGMRVELTAIATKPGPPGEE